MARRWVFLSVIPLLLCFLSQESGAQERFIMDKKGMNSIGSARMDANGAIVLQLGQTQFNN